MKGEITVRYFLPNSVYIFVPISKVCRKAGVVLPKTKTFINYYHSFRTRFPFIFLHDELMNCYLDNEC